MTGQTAETVYRIRALNDAFRKNWTLGRVFLSAGISGLDEEARVNVLSAVIVFDQFTPDNDPFGEHDCAIVAIDGLRALWKIDYYDKDLRFHSEDPADPGKTTRVMTIMFPDEY
ncbi:DUF3768 domain-containing protein [Microbaculum marinum]|uniref:DUF3768 domain-containing protein n=1 Tax=Microbaculum marinum TaxID=1764581 RepID=A0AAW9S0R8_9HYPH